MRQTTIRQFDNPTIDLDKIRAVAGNPSLAEEEVFDFPKFVIARSGRNRNRTDISPEGQKAAVAEWIGKPVYFRDHEMKAENQIGRIYDAWTEDVEGETVTFGRAFAIATEEDADLHAKIRNRIHKEMSCAYRPVKSVCSLCGIDTLSGHCPTHQAHAEYRARDLEFKPDHVSFVGRAGVEGAGLTANARQDDPELPRLRALAADGEIFRSWAATEFTTWFKRNNPTVSAEEMKTLTDKLSAKELLTFARVEQSRFAEALPDGRQQLQAPEERQADYVSPEEIKSRMMKGLKP